MRVNSAFRIMLGISMWAEDPTRLLAQSVHYLPSSIHQCDDLGLYGTKWHWKLYICEGIMNATKYAAVLETKLLPSAKSLFAERSWLFQDYNLLCQRAKLVKKWMQSHGIYHMKWPAHSPDLNPIANLWHIINFIIAKEKSSD